MGTTVTVNKAPQATPAEELGETRAQRPDVRAFACAAEHTEAICGTCTATIVARGGGCPMCRAPVLGWVAALRN